MSLLYKRLARSDKDAPISFSYTCDGIDWFYKDHIIHLRRSYCHGNFVQ